ncbi:MAG: O-antigen ligase family protein [Actinomycetia bacterium]|nr:O-antigen ligase family protein [Actinomycetes bacterium]
MAGLLLTRSRGSYIGFIIGAVIVLWLYYRSLVKFFITMGLMLAASIPMVLFTGTFDRIKMIFDLSEDNVSIRFLLWERAWHLFTRSPIFGIGFGRYNDIHYKNWGETIPSLDLFIGYPNIAAFYMEPSYRFSFSHAHNAYFQFLAETGVIGLGLLLFFWILCYRKILKGYNLTRDGFSKKVFLSSLGGIAALFALSLTENYFSATTVMICLAMTVSLAIGLFWQESFNGRKE